jgi:hypothetical protein
MTIDTSQPLSNDPDLVEALLILCTVSMLATTSPRTLLKSTRVFPQPLRETLRRLSLTKNLKEYPHGLAILQWIEAGEEP